MADQKVNIKVTTQGAKKAKEELGGLSGSINKMGKAVGIASAAYFGAQGLISGLGSVIRLAGEQEQAEKQLSFALGRTSNALLAQASALQKTTRFGDEATIAQMGFLASIGFTEEKIQQVIPVAMDLAEATGMSLESAVRNTAKTFSGMAGELGELVPQIRELTAEQMKAGEAVKVMGDLFEGQASAQAETLTGSIDQMKNSVGDAAEALGSLLAPVVIEIADVIKLASQGVESLIGNFDNIITGGSLAQAEFALVNTEMEDFKKVVDELGFFSLLEMNNQLNDLLSTMPIVTPEVQKLMDQQVILAEKMNESTQEIKKQKFEINYDEEIKQGTKLTESTLNRINAEKELAKAKQEQLTKDLKGAALSGQSALGAMKSVVRAESMEAIAGLISSIFKTMPFPLNVALAAGAGTIATGIIDGALGQVKAETGFEGIVTKPTMFLTGENNKPEQVSVTPLGGGSASGITVNISAPLLDDTVVESIIPAIERAKKLGIA